MIGTGAFKLKSLHAEQAAPSSCASPATGAAARRSTASSSRSTRARRRWCSHCAPVRSTSPSSCRRRRPRPFKNNSRYKIFGSPTSTHRMFGLRVDSRPVQGRAGAPGGRAHAQPPRADQDAPPRRGRRSGTTPRSGRDFPSTDPRSTSGSRTSRSRRRCCRRPGKSNLKFTVTTWNGARPPRLRDSIQVAGKQAGMDIQLEVLSADDYYGGPGADYYDDDAVDEQARRRSPSTAPAGCRTCSSPPRTSRTASGTPRTTRTRRSTRRRSRTSRRPRSSPSGSGHEEDRGHPAERHPGDHLVLLSTTSPRARRRSRTTSRRASARIELAESRWHSAMRQRAAGAARRRPPRRLDESMTRYVLKRLGLALITLVLLSMIVFATAQLLPGNVGPHPARAVRAAEAVDALQQASSAPTGRPSSSTCDWLGGVAARRPRRLARPGPVRSGAARAGARQLAQARARRVPARASRFGILGGVFAGLRAGRAADRTITVVGLSLAVVPEFVTGHRPASSSSAIWLGWLPVTAQWAGRRRAC